MNSWLEMVAIWLCVAILFFTSFFNANEFDRRLDLLEQKCLEYVR